jgi:hypothetical protein
MTKKDFEAIAEEIRAVRQRRVVRDEVDVRFGISLAIQAIGKACQERNDKFNWEQFRDACEV